MCQIAKQLLAEKLIDDFWEEYAQAGKPQNTENLLERLKALVPVEQLDLLYLWEAQCAENSCQELRQFSEFVAGILLAHRHEEGDGGDG